MKTISIPAFLVAITLTACQSAPTAFTDADRLAIEASSRN